MILCYRPISPLQFLNNGPLGLSITNSLVSRDAGLAHHQSPISLLCRTNHILPRVSLLDERERACPTLIFHWFSLLKIFYPPQHFNITSTLPGIFLKDGPLGLPTVNLPICETCDCNIWPICPIFIELVGCKTMGCDIAGLRGLSIIGLLCPRPSDKLFLFISGATTLLIFNKPYLLIQKSIFGLPYTVGKLVLGTMQWRGSNFTKSVFVA